MFSMEDMLDNLFSEETVVGESQSEFFDLWNTYKLDRFYSDDFVHGKPHITRVYNYSEDIVSRMKNNGKKFSNDEILIIRLSALLHDITRDTDDKTHQISGAEKAKEILKDSVDSTIVKQVADNILSHRYSVGMKSTFLASILQDADRLDALGVIGFLRTIMSGIENKRVLFDETKYPKTKYDGNSATTVNHIFEKLLKIDKKSFSNKESGSIGGEKYELLKAMMKDFIGVSTSDKKWLKLVK